jgi:hypothetical protein
MTDLNPVDAMTNPYRAMCAELVDALENARRIIDGAGGTLHINTAEFVLRRARALLDQPVAERPSDWDLKVIMDSVGGPQFDSGPRWMLPFARAVLARYGGSTSTPEATNE